MESFFFQIKINIRVNIFFNGWTLWTLRIWHILFHGFRQGSVNWTWMEGNIWDQGVIVCHLATHDVYGMHQILGIHVVCFSYFYFCPFRNFLWLWDGWLIDWLVGSGLFLLDPALTWPICSLSILPCLGMVYCFSGFRLGSKFFPMLWTSGSFILLDIACDLVY